MDEIKPKWKAFAAEMMLSDWGEGISAEWVFFLIVNSPAEELEETIEANRILVWEPFTSLSPEDLAWKMEQIASTAQATEEMK